MANPLSYAEILRDAERARFAVDDVTANLFDLDFDKPFFPEPLVHAERLNFLNHREKIIVNQVRARAYLGLAVLAEKLVVPFVMSQAARCLHGDLDRFSALMGFGQQAAKHMVAFERFATACEQGFDAEFGIIGPAEDINARFLIRDTMAVGLLVLHLECLTQPHYVRAARSCQTMDERFKELLHVHWREETQNARLTALVLSDLCKQSSQFEKQRAVEQYLEMLGEFSDAAGAQIELDIAAFESVARPLSEQERQEWRREQSPSYHEMLLCQGIDSPILRRSIAQDFGGPMSALEEASCRFSKAARAPEPTVSQ